MSNITDNFFGLIKFGNESWLKNIKEGKLWFRSLKYYQEYESEDNIGDKYEGLTHIYYPENDTKMYYSPNIDNYNLINLSNNSVFLYPDFYNNLFIFCCSYISIPDIKNKTIYDDSFLLEKDWTSVFFFFDPVEFISLINKSLKLYKPEIRKIEYMDYSKTQKNLNYFNKSKDYENQKEVRIAIHYNGEPDEMINIINEDTIEIDFKEKIEGFIIPTNSFREGFIVTEINGVNNE